MTHSEILEIGKFMSDLFALVTTLDTGMLGVVVAIVEKVFTTERVFRSSSNKVLLMASLFSFIGSLAFSLIALVVIPYNVKEMLLGKSGIWVDVYSFYGSLGLFIFGIILFVILATRSVFSSSVPDRQTKRHGGKEAQPAK